MTETAKKEKTIDIETDKQVVKSGEKAASSKKSASKSKDKKKAGNNIGKKVQFASYAMLDVTERIIGGLMKGYESIFVGGPKRQVNFDKESGMTAYEKGDYQAAIEYLCDYISDGNAGDAEALFTLGLSYSKLDMYQDAIEYFKKAEAIEDDSDIRHELAECYMHIEDYSNAIVYLKKCVEAEEDNADNYYFLGTCYEKTEKPDDAKQMYKKAIDADPRVAVYYQALGFVYENTGSHKDAIACFKKAMDLDRDKKRD